jgi:hypothetical protein
MPTPISQSYGGFSYGKATAAAGTVINRPIPPFANQAGAPGMGVLPAGTRPRGITHITTLIYNLAAAGSHVLTVMRPLNWTTFTAAAAAGQPVVTLAADPGVYTAGGYRYGLPNAQTAPRVANNPITANDFVMYQLADGTWVADKVVSVAGLNITLTNNLLTGGVVANAPFYHFGITTDLDPATGEAHVAADIVGAAAGNLSFYDPTNLWCALHQGDPLLLQSNNAAVVGTFEVTSGFYSEH